MMRSWLRSRFKILIAHVVIHAAISEEFETVVPMNNNDSLSGIYATTGRTLGNCPIPDQRVTCIAVHEPYRCGADSCNYSNDCLARAANYNITEDCVKVNDRDITPPSIPSNDTRVESLTTSPTTTKENDQIVVTMNNNDSLSGMNSSSPTTSYATVNDVDNIPTSVPSNDDRFDKSDASSIAPPTSNNDRSYSTNLKISRLSCIIGFFAWSLFLF